MRMYLINRCINHVISQAANIRRRIYNSKRRKKLTNTTPTIISMNCFGGFIYHDLKLQFLSPTINLYFSKKDFFCFVLDLKGFLSAELIEEETLQQNFPVGLLTSNDVTIHVYFLHYNSFDEAKEKWNERKKRVQYDNISIIMQVEDELSDDDVIQFENIPYSNKVLISKTSNRWEYDNIFCLEMMNNPEYTKGGVLWIPNTFI